METGAAPTRKRKFVFPHPYIVLLAIVLICSLLSYVLPSSSFDYVEVSYTNTDGSTKTRNVIDPDTYTVGEINPVTPMQFLTSLIRGADEMSTTIFFVFIVVGCFYVLGETGAVTAGIGRMVKTFGKNKIFVIPVLYILFAAAGTTMGLYEELMCFIPILIPLFIAMGYDSLLATGVVLSGAIAGWAGATLNPFTLGIAQGISGLPLFSGLGYHIVCFVCFVTLGIVWFIFYAKKLEKSPKISVVYDLDNERGETERVDMDSLPEFTARRKIILGVLIVTIGILVYGLLKLGWYFEEMSALFLVMAVVVTLIAGNSLNWFAGKMVEGMRMITQGAMVIAFARAIVVVLNDSGIINTILNGMANAVKALPAFMAVVGQYIFQCLLNFIVPSGSGQATLTMPIMAPLADLTGITRQTAVLCEIMGDAISNVFTPTAGAFMAALGLAGIPWNKWIKWYAPLLGFQYLLGLILVIVAQIIQIGPF